MKKMIALFSLVSLFGCEIYITKPSDDTGFYQSIDWVTDGVFTKGIEGPAVAQDGTLYVVNYQKNGTIGRVSAKNEVSQFIQLPNNSIGNGLRFDKQGNMYIADYVNHNILIVESEKLDLAVHNTVAVYAHSPLMNQPNDIAINDAGIIFASDPNWAKGNGNIWRIGKDRQVTLLESGMGTTNGIEVSPDNLYLYVNESVQRNVWQYQLDKSGNLSNKKLFIHFTDHGLDGMRTDQLGNLYIARYGKGVIAIISPQGELLREVVLKGDFPTNVAFGGENGKRVFVTMQKRGAIESFLIE
jgi:sugar lactone lactonase YvrE